MAETSKLTDEQYNEIQEAIELLSLHREDLNKFEEDFLESTLERERTYGQRMYMSQKQWAALRKMTGQFA